MRAGPFLAVQPGRVRRGVFLAACAAAFAGCGVSAGPAASGPPGATSDGNPLAAGVLKAGTAPAPLAAGDRLVGTAPPCPPAEGAGPSGVRVVASAPPPVGPAPSAGPSGLVACEACEPLTGRVYDVRGQLVTAPLTVRVGPADGSFPAVVVGEVEGGAFAIPRPALAQTALVSIGGAGHGTRVRPYPGREGYASTFDFGGPGATDPDAPGFFLPSQGVVAGFGALPLAPAVGTIGSLTARGVFDAPRGLARLPDGRLAVVDEQRALIAAVAPDGSVAPLAGHDEGEGYVPDDRRRRDGQGAEARFWGPTGLAAGPDGRLYVADTYNRAIRVVAPDGRVTTLAASGPEPADGPARPFARPLAVAVDGRGTAYVLDADRPLVLAVDATGAVSTFAGAETAGYVNGLAAQARFGRLGSIAVGPDGTVYVGDAGNRRIRRIRDGRVTDVYGGPVAGADGTTAYPPTDDFLGLAVAPDGDLVFVAYAQLMRVAPDGRIRRLAGTSWFGRADGLAGEATLNVAPGVVAGPDGAVWFTDVDTKAVRRYVP